MYFVLGSHGKRYPSEEPKLFSLCCCSIELLSTPKCGSIKLPFTPKCGRYPLKRSETATRHGRRADPAVGIWKPGRPTGDTRAGMTYGSLTRTGTGSPSTDGQSGEGSDGRSGVWMESGLNRREEKRVSDGEAVSRNAFHLSDR